MFQPLRGLTVATSLLLSPLYVSAQSFAPLAPTTPADPSQTVPPQAMPATATDQPAVTPQPGVKVEERGPIHEAFAQPGAPTRGQGMTAPKAPPPNVPEVPPDQKPNGENVQWIPGYWSWDADRQDYLWVSGFWRNVPPGEVWQPGQWATANGQSMYTPGYWKPATAGVQGNLPEPPKSLENGPSVPAKNADSVWVPGSWQYQNGQYAWQPGYWAQPYGNMLWQPSQYVYDGTGYTYVPGYWDYPLEDRGILYAPVTFTQPLWQNPGWAYTPQYALGLGYGSGWGMGGLFGSLYLGPGYNNYYYGNYYGGLGFGGLGYGGLGFGYLPWWYSGRGYYNPLWNHYNWLNRGNPGWAAGARQGYYGYNGAHAGRYYGSLAGVGGPAAYHAGLSNPGVRGNLVQPAAGVVRAQQLARPVGSYPNVGMHQSYQNLSAGAFGRPGFGAVPYVGGVGYAHSPGVSYAHPGYGSMGHAYGGYAPHVSNYGGYHGGYGGYHAGGYGGYHGGGGGFHGGGGHGGGHGGHR